MSRSAYIVEVPRATALRPLNYSREVELLRQSAGGRESFPLSTVLHRVGENYGKVFTRRDALSPSGVELLSQADMFSAEPEGRRISRDSMPDPEQHMIRRGQVLIAGAGTLGETELYGRAVFADQRLEGKYVGPDAVVLDFLEPEGDLALFTYAFLCTDVGIRAVRATSYGTKILRFRHSMLLDLPIPRPADDVVARVASLVRRSIAAREAAFAGRSSARAVVEELPEMQEAWRACADRRARAGVYSAPFGTLSAWNFASCGRAPKLLRESWTAQLGDVMPAGGIFRGLRFARVACKSPFGVSLLTQRDVFLVRAIPQRVVHPGIADEWLRAPAGSLLASGSGGTGEGHLFGRVALVTPDMSELAISEDLLRLQPVPSASPLAYAFLSTALGRRLLRSAAVGTIILRMRPDLLRKLPFPTVTHEQNGRILAYCNAAVAAQDQGTQLESEAISIVEKEVLPSWLN